MPDSYKTHSKMSMLLSVLFEMVGMDSVGVYGPRGYTCSKMIQSSQLERINDSLTVGDTLASFHSRNRIS